MVFLKIFENSQENPCAWVSFLIKLQSWVSATLLQKETLTGVFLWILPNLLRTSFLTKHLRWLFLSSAQMSDVLIIYLQKHFSRVFKKKFFVYSFFKKSPQSLFFFFFLEVLFFDVNDVVLVFLLLTSNIFHTFFKCFYCWLWTSKC